MIYGNYKNVGHSESIQETNQRMYNEFKARNVSIGGVIAYMVRAVIVVDPELMKSILVKDSANFPGRANFNLEFEPLLGNLFFLEGEAWRLLRMKIAPMFSLSKIRVMFETILEVEDQLENYLMDATANGGQELEMKYIMAGNTMDVIGTCALGIKCNSLRDNNSELHKIFNEITDQTPVKLLLLTILLSFKRLSAMFKIKPTIANVEKFFVELVRSTIDYREKNNIQRNDFLNLLIQLKNSDDPEESLTIEEITAQVFFFFWAGFDTSASGLVCCLHELAMNPDIQEKVRSEIMRVCDDRVLTYERVSSVEYLNMVIDETFRKYPPGDLHRNILQDYQVPGSDLKLPANTMVIIPTFAIHHDPEHYPEPERFDPERFNATNRANRHPYVYLPFGKGPRYCIGMRFGLTQTTLWLDVWHPDA
ncbi:probable cytochrome P450 6a14 isoform X2 [Toxorhynchites rutilus septentrionalis]|uniref:probable cytochrome P450 6a14 isoform X2 n=1 Tax=Toxorhynchites rutilus septentrionalis TaxID=329112 RepID=UPI0024797C12|nr:probable cytochrome P450 6a14 isoform X2 [Toxorhynchites rutilus septentrionalis]